MAQIMKNASFSAALPRRRPISETAQVGPERVRARNLDGVNQPGVRRLRALASRAKLLRRVGPMRVRGRSNRREITPGRLHRKLLAQ